jgi:hypothetical protein
VRDEHVRESELVLQILEQVHDAGSDRDVERREGLIEHETLWFEYERPGDPDALTLPAGELVRISVHVGDVETDEPHHFPHALAPAVLPQPVHLERIGDDRMERHRRVERRVRVGTRPSESSA